jgi:hypothetical protein
VALYRTLRLARRTSRVERVHDTFARVLRALPPSCRSLARRPRCLLESLCQLVPPMPSQR